MNRGFLSLLELRSTYFSELTPECQNKVQHSADSCWVFLLFIIDVCIGLS